MNIKKTGKISFTLWVIELFTDERGNTSIKPVIAFIGALFLCVTMVVSGINNKFIPSDTLINAVMVITSIGLGADTVDKFSHKKPYRSSNDFDPIDESGSGEYSPDDDPRKR